MYVLSVGTQLNYKNYQNLTKRCNGRFSWLQLTKNQIYSQSSVKIMLIDLGLLKQGPCTFIENWYIHPFIDIGYSLNLGGFQCWVRYPVLSGLRLIAKETEQGVTITLYSNFDECYKV